MTKELYTKLIADAEREIEVIKLRIIFWQRKETEHKGNHTEIMNQLMNQTAQQVLQEEWLKFVKEKSVEMTEVEKPKRDSRGAKKHE